MRDRDQDRQLPFFVYGTLRRGHSNHRVILAASETALFGVEARLDGYGLFDAGIPFVREVPGAAVVGELYRFAPHDYPVALQHLDGLEGYHETSPATSLYVRTALTVCTVGGESVEAWVYVGGRSFDGVERAVASGDWSVRHAA